MLHRVTSLISINLMLRPLHSRGRSSSLFSKIWLKIAPTPAVLTLFVQLFPLTFGCNIVTSLFHFLIKDRSSKGYSHVTGFQKPLNLKQNCNNVLQMCNTIVTASCNNTVVYYSTIYKKCYTKPLKNAGFRIFSPKKNFLL